MSWPDDGRYDGRGSYSGDVVAGIVERVDVRNGSAEVREQRSGRTVYVELRTGRRSRLRIEDLRRGDYVELSGVWSGRRFEAYDIEAVRDRY